MSWDRFNQYYLSLPELDFALDVSRMNFTDSFLDEMEPAVQKAYGDMAKLEGGAIANPDEGRMVGHYWLRDADKAPSPELAQEIRETLDKIKSFAAKVHKGQIVGEKGTFSNLLVIGIGGSALGPQFVAQALGHPAEDKLNVYFFDNTDPDGMDLTLAQLDGQLGKTLALVISKSGSTPETRNGMLEAEAAWKKAGLSFGKHAVAVTGLDSKLHLHAKSNDWIEFFPMWDWVGGRTSELAAVGLLPAALQGLDIDGLLAGAKAMDEQTRVVDTRRNPAALLALMWYYATNGKGDKDMVILPYKDRLMLFSKYLQQLIMESLGKELDLQGNTVNQGIAVYGNKGSTDQHAYVQQLREGVNNFFATFIEVLKDREGSSVEVETQTTAGDFLNGLLLGTREALSGNDRESITLTIKEVSPCSVGMLIALYERAVGFYASLTGINAYHQPGVEAGKKAAASTLSLKNEVRKVLEKNGEKALTAAEIASQIADNPNPELVFKLLEHMTVNSSGRIVRQLGENPSGNTYCLG